MNWSEKPDIRSVNAQITDKNWEDLLRTNVIYGAVFKAAVRYTKDLQLTDKTLKYFYE